MHRLSPEQVAELVAARQAGVQIKDLAQQFEIHKTTVIAHLERAGVPGRRWAGKTLSPPQVQDAARLYESGLSLVAIGEQLGASRRQVGRALDEAGVAIRSPGRQRC